MSKLRNPVWMLALILPILASGCAGKAQALKVSVAQFEAESLAAINGIERMRDAELAPLEVPAAEASRRFVDNAMTSTRPAVPSRIELWMNPNDVEIDAEEEKRWKEQMESLRAQYAAFARIFDSVEEASFTARDEVGKARPHAEKLTAQMVAFSSSISRHPVRMLNRRGALAAELEAIRRDDQLDQAQKRQAIAEWRDRWIVLTEEEDGLTRATVTQTLKAAKLGAQLRTQIVNYDKLSINDILEGAGLALRLAGEVSGKDLSSIRADAERLAAEAKSDPVWSRTADTVLREINQAVAARNPAEDGGQAGEKSDVAGGVGATAAAR
jgi:hypothetical protein